MHGPCISRELTILKWEEFNADSGGRKGGDLDHVQGGERTGEKPGCSEEDSIAYSKMWWASEESAYGYLNPGHGWLITWRAMPDSFV